MKITYKGDYALKAILELAINYERGVVTINDMANRIDAPVKFLETVLSDLKKGGFVQSRRGKVGGYLLAKAPVEITVGEIIRFVEGYIAPISCVRADYSDCKDVGRCVFRKIWQDVAEKTSEIVDSITFEELVSRSDSRQKAIAYSI